MKLLLSYARYLGACVLAAALACALGLSPALATGGPSEGPQPGPLPSRTEAGAEPDGDGSEAPAPLTVDAATAPRYFLTNLGQCTTSKIQKPWGACWAFAVAGAIESSILKAEAVAAGQDQARLPADSPAFASPTFGDVALSPDISERAIAWFSHEPQTDQSAGTQAGEGFALIDDAPENQLSGGNFATAVSALTAWQSLVTEEAAPYEYNGYDPASSRAWYAMDPAFDARYEDWSLPEEMRTTEDAGWRVSDVLRMESPAQVSAEAAYTGYDAEATTAIKEALVNVGGVAVALAMEQNIPTDVWQGNYTDAEPLEHLTFTTWSEYDDAATVAQNHAALVVGWDDAYPAASFQGTGSSQPPGDGAWLCKNSWGNDGLYSAMDAMDEATRWGIVDENGQATGFFWLSYYDHTIADPEAFVVMPADESYDTLYQHDYVGAAEYVTPVKYSGLVQAANAFTAESTQLVEAVTGWTFAPNTACTATVGVLPYGFDVTGSTPDEVMAASAPMAHAAGVFDQAGFHTLELDSPVLVVEGQAFTITLEIAAEPDALDEESGQIDAAAESYLGLEVAYLDAASTGQPTAASAIANAGETFVCVDGSTWMSIADFNDERAEVRAKGGNDLDFVYGSAIVKGLANATTMGDPSRVYQILPLSPVQP